MSHRLSVFMLSSFSVALDGHPINGRLGKSGQLLKILAANYRRCVSKDALIEMLWPDGDPRTGAISLKVAAHKLRITLDPDKENGDEGTWIVAQDGTYRLNPAADIWIDTEAFREHYERGRALESQRQLADARNEFEQAEALYRSDYLEEDLYDEWTVVRREELRDLYLDSLQRLAHLALKDQAHADVIRYCHKIVLADPCREDAYRMLMRSHGALNQFARAGAWYAVCRMKLQREVDVPPSPETVEAFESLFEGGIETTMRHPTA